MIKFLATILAGIMMVSTSFAAPLKGVENKEAAKEAVKDLATKNAEEKEVKIEEAYKAIIGKNDQNSKANIAKMRSLFSSTESFVEALEIYVKAGTGSEMQKSASSHVKYILAKFVKGEFGSPQEMEIVKAILGAAKTVISENKGNAELETISKLAKQLSAFNNAKTTGKMSSEDAAELSFISAVANKGSFRSLDDAKKELSDYKEVKEEYERWKKDCAGKI